MSLRRASPLEPFVWALVWAFPVALVVLGILLFTSDFEWRGAPSSAWRTGTDLDHSLMAADFAKSGELMGRTRAEVLADFGEPMEIRTTGGRHTELVYDAGPDASGGRQGLFLEFDPSERVISVRF